MKMILNEEDQYAKMQNEISNQVLHISEQLHLKKMYWQEFKTHCQFNRPIVSTIEDSTISNKDNERIIPKMTIDSSHIKIMVEKYATFVTDYLKHKDLEI